MISSILGEELPYFHLKEESYNILVFGAYC